MRVTVCMCVTCVLIGFKRVELKFYLLQSTIVPLSDVGSKFYLLLIFCVGVTKASHNIDCVS